MELKQKIPAVDQASDQQNGGQPKGYKINAEGNEEEKDLKRTSLFGSSSMKSPDDEGMEGKGMGGHNFGRNNITQAGNDQANPSQMAGNNNAYFNRTQPAEEHPENNNFKAPAQEGEADYDKAMHGGGEENPGESDAVGKTEDGNYNPDSPYQEGTADEDGDNSKKQQVNIPGPNEAPDQQKVAE
ncbi:hypothetical protein [Mucilaginibacter endophyticus]|uniref:hypothetical protein n=1 Tax=Mucilaginibacter endophyticus TaxID=2675003 RepID=UPI000E0D949E|nr:hypothetical protein [Mucilaginibacter endophyticus]